MFARWLKLGIVVVAGTALSVAGTLAQGQGKKSKVTLEYEPGEAIIRCEGPAGTFTDALCGDGSASYVDESLGGGDTGVRVGLRESDNNFRLHFFLDGGATRFATVFFPQPELPLEDFECPDADCLAAIGGGRASGLYIVQQNQRSGAYVSVTLWDNGNIIDNGLGSIPVGESADGDGHVVLTDPGDRGYSWGLWWTERNYPGTTPVTVTRTAQCAWTIVADDNAIAGLRLYNTGLKGKNRNPYEGRFNMPFQIDFTSPGCGLPDPTQP